jgi:DUF4097 and DUF4098 domain-containing protein YvlB
MKRKWTTCLILAGLMVYFGFSPAMVWAKEKVEDKFEQTVSLSRDGQVNLSNIAGNIEVKTWNKNEVLIKALKVSKADSMEEARENADLVTIEVTENGNRVQIKTEYPKNKFRNRSISVSVDYWLTIPDRADADINSVSGDIVMMNIGGKMDAQTVSGDVDLSNIRGLLRAKSTSGDVTVEKAANGVGCNSISGDLDIRDITGDADLKSVSGDINLLNLREGDVDAETVSGDIDLEGVANARDVEAGSVSGEIKYTGTINPQGRYYLKSHSGEITVVIPGDSAFDLESKTFSGSIESDFEITMSGKISNREISGAVNGGGARLELKTFSGDVVLRKR